MMYVDGGWWVDFCLWNQHSTQYHHNGLLEYMTGLKRDHIKLFFCRWDYVGTVH
jgi:hypothetical protein